MKYPGSGSVWQNILLPSPRGGGENLKPIHYQYPLLLLLAVLLFLSNGSMAYAHGNEDDDAPRRTPVPGMTLPDFSLTDQQGKPFTRADLGNRPSLFFFGYTNCPDVCPSTLIDMSAFLEKLAKQDAARVNMVFVTVDPGRDNVNRLSQYMAQYDPRIVALTGPRAAIHKLTDAAYVYVEKVEAGEKGNDTGRRQINQTATIYLYDGRGVFT